MADLPIIYLRRLWTGDQGTVGVLIDSEGVLCNTLELPWRNNTPKLSCIPCGTYTVKIRQSPKFGRVYMVHDVEGRSYILTHSGNLAGDILKGYITHVQGCILLGTKLGRINKQLAVLNSRTAVSNFMNHMAYEPFTLVVDYEEIGGIDV